jgi:hypothetical protein
MAEPSKVNFEREKFVELMLYFCKRGIEEGSRHWLDEAQQVALLL